VKTDLSTQIRALVDTAPPVSCAEALSRAGGQGATDAPFAGRSGQRPRHAGSHSAIAAVAASALVLAGAGGAWLAGAAGSSGSQRPSYRQVTNARQPVAVMLTARELSDIRSDSSSAMASTGTAQVTDSTTDDGTAQSSESIAVTFDGANLDEQMAVTDESSSGSQGTFTVDDRLVGSQFYLYTPGPDDVTRWYHDIGQDATSSMVFPDPRTLYSEISPSADFEVVGTTTENGVAITHMRALNPAAVEVPSLGGLADSTVTAFDLWVDQDDVVQSLAIDSSQVEQACVFNPAAFPSRQALRNEMAKLQQADKVRFWIAKPGSLLGEGLQCGPQTTADSVGVTFADIGSPESVVAPQGATDVVGLG